MAAAHGVEQGRHARSFRGQQLTYFNEMPWTVSVLAKSRGLDMQTYFVGRSGATLEDLWRDNEALFRIRDKRWDYVVFSACKSCRNTHGVFAM